MDKLPLVGIGWLLESETIMDRSRIVLTFLYLAFAGPVMAQEPTWTPTSGSNT